MYSAGNSTNAVGIWSRGIVLYLNETDWNCFSRSAESFLVAGLIFVCSVLGTTLTTNDRNRRLRTLKRQKKVCNPEYIHSQLSCPAEYLRSQSCTGIRTLGLAAAQLGNYWPIFYRPIHPIHPHRSPPPLCACSFSVLPGTAPFLFLLCLRLYSIPSFIVIACLCALRYECLAPSRRIFAVRF